MHSEAHSLSPCAREKLQKSMLRIEGAGQPLSAQSWGGNLSLCSHFYVLCDGAVDSCKQVLRQCPMLCLTTRLWDRLYNVLNGWRINPYFSIYDSTSKSGDPPRSNAIRIVIKCSKAAASLEEGPILLVPSTFGTLISILSP